MEVVTTQSPRQKYIDALKTSFVTLGKKTLLAALAGLPYGVGAFFAWGPLPYLSGLAIEWGLSKLVNGAETGVFFVYTDFRVASQQDDFIDAAIRNHNAQINGTPEEKDAAEKHLIKTFDNFVKLNRL